MIEIFIILLLIAGFGSILIIFECLRYFLQEDFGNMKSSQYHSMFIKKGDLVPLNYYECEL